MASLGSGVPEVIARHRPAIEAALEEWLASDGVPLTRPARYVMGWEDETGRRTESGGKRIRPALAMVGAEIAGGRAEDGLPGAIALELIHNFSLVHDEIQDEDDVRHGRPTAYTIWGPGQAINLGDFMFGRALQALTRDTANAERRVRALDVLLHAIEGMIAGQWRDIEFESREAVSVDEYLAMVEGKTGVLLGSSVELGAILGGARDADAAVLGRWGTRLGLAFQAVDDYLGIWGDEALTGKTTTGDIARKKKTLPIVHGLSDPDAGALIRRTFAANEQLERQSEIVAALEACGADDLCREMARRFAGEAESLAGTLRLSPESRATLGAVADYFCDRDF